MEKRRVRVYKAQEGGQPSADMLGYPGSQEQQQQSNQGQMSEDMLMQSIMLDISKDVPEASIMGKLVNILGLDIQSAKQYVEAAYTMLESQMEDEATDEVETPEKAAEEVMTETLVEDKPMSKIKNHIDLVEDGDDSEDDTDLDDENMVKYGGMPRADEGMEVEDPNAQETTQDWGEENYPITFPGLESYMPSNFGDIYGNPAAEIAWQAPNDQLQEEQQQEQVQDEEESYSDPVVDPSEFRMGGFKNKKSYVLSVLKLVKKQMGGGDEETESANADFSGDDFRKGRLSAFLGSVKSEGNLTLAKKQAEEAYDNQMAMYQQQMQQSQQPDLNQFIPQDEMGMDQAQYGGSPRQERKAMRRLNRAMRNVPQGIGSMGALTKFDVRRSGVFGGPKEYSMEFDPSPLVQLAYNPMLSSMYGYGARTKVTRTPARVKTEYIRNVVNNEAIKEVAKATPDSTATSKATDTPVNTSTTANPNLNWQTSMPYGRSNAADNNIHFKNERVQSGNTDYKGTIGVDESAIWSSPLFQGDYNAIRDLEDKIGYDKLTPEQKDILGQSSYITKDAQGNEYSSKSPRTPDTEAIYDKQINDSVLQNYQYNLATGHNFQDDKEAYDKAIELAIKNKSKVGPRIPNTFVSYPSMQQFGGSTNSSSVNEYGDLQKFMGGGDEDPSIANLTEADMYGTNSKDTTDAYMPQAQYGGYGRQLIQNYFPANLPQRRTYSQLTKGPYNSKTGEAFSSIPGFNPNAVIKDINVTKKGVFGRPKQYSVTYNNNPSGRPEDRLLAHSQLIPSTTGKEEIRSLFGNKEKGTNLDPWARSDQRKNDRWEAQRKRQGYVEDTGETPMSNEEYMKLYKANLPVSNADYMQKYNANNLANKALEDKREAEYMQHYNETRNPYLHDPNSVNIPRQMATDELTEDGLPTDYYAYGGAYDLPEALLGAENPVSLENNPANGDLQPMKPLGTENAMKELRAQSEERNKGAYQPDEYTVDYDAKREWMGDTQGALLSGNAAVIGATGLLDRRDQRKQEAAMYDNMTADSLYASDPSRDRGDYDTNSGLYRPNEQGQMWNSRSKQYGGPIYEDGGYVEGSEVFMDDDELNEFLANGGEVEYI
jgi:hypothetical protein